MNLLSRVAEWALRPALKAGRRACGCGMAALALWGTAVQSRAEWLRLELRLESPSVLQFESLPAHLSLVNESSEAFELGSAQTPEAGQLEFMIELKRDEPARKVGAAALVQGVMLWPGEKREITIDLLQWYDMSEMGRYTVWAQVVRKGQIAGSNHTIVDVVHGIELAGSTRPLPTDSARERTYSLRYWPRDRKEYLFLCVTEPATGYSYGVFPLGTLVRVFKPVMDIDVSGSIRIEHQATKDCFVTSVLRSLPQGVQLVSQTQHTADGQPYPIREPTSGAAGTNAPAPPAKKGRR
jgi:hypothetical protein